ncbi:bifunctional DNA primase/polymerase [Caulobacter segnis]|uniref:DNA primase/polymerase bifunctional N-terminal domain-containing protein n=1 Tax=Caulobacter segnis TaxID=88688 RepID=A0A2W5WNC3_9CAUL|nr:bifunctional DNA primase/polymerase [Caulobacter segnis]PZR35498.1 MAG: hypothetical protein DI526_06990 [Caulobacter segnis]
MSTERSKAARPDLGPYGRLAYAYAVAGVPTFPVCPQTKKPLVRQYAKRIPSTTTIETWAQRHPHASLGFATRRAGVVVLDADDAEALAYFREHAGPPVLRTLTPKGEHWWFTDPGRRRRGGNRPTDRAYDIKGAKSCDLVLLPGSVSANGVYTLADGGSRDVPGLFAERLRRLTPLTDDAYETLMGPGGLDPASRRFGQAPIAMDSVALLALDRVPEGHRNQAVFAYARRQCRQVRREVSDAAGLEVLLARVSHYNQMACDPPLDDAEVEKTAQSAWRWELANMIRLPANRAREIRKALIDHQGEARAVTLLLLLSQTSVPGEDLVLTPSRLVKQCLVPTWSQTHYRTAIDALVATGRLRITERARRGRGRTGTYRLASPLVSSLNITNLLARLDGNADAATLYAIVAEQWGAPSTAELSVRGMCAQRGGPFGTWDERRLRRARNRLEAADLLERRLQPRLGPRTPRAMFSVRSLDVPDVPKIIAIAPEENHRPLGLTVNCTVLSSPAPMRPVERPLDPAGWAKPDQSGPP